MKRKHRKHKTVVRPHNCFNCGHCLYIGEGDFICEARCEIVLMDWNEPTEEFLCCGGEEYLADETEESDR